MPAPQGRRGTRSRQAEESGDRDSPPDAVGEASHAEDAARGNAPDTGKDVTAGRRPHRTRAPDTVGSAARQPTARRGRAAKAPADTPHRCRDLSGCRNVQRLLDCGGALHKDAASGGEGVTWQEYGEHLPANGAALGAPLKQQRSRAQWMRRRYLPQGKGQERP